MIRQSRNVVGFGLVLASAILAGRLLAEPPAMPKLSAIVPAEDLAGQMDAYLKELDQSLADEASYKSSADKVKRIANTIAVLAYNLGKHDTAVEMTPAAADIGRAARGLAKAKDYASARERLDTLHRASKNEAKLPAEPATTRIASLGQIMNEAELLNTRLRTSLRRFDARRLSDNARAAAALAAIAQASVYDTHEVKDPQQLPQWYQFAGEMRDAAGELNAKIRAKDKTGATAALGRLDKSCKSCHAVFEPME